MTDIPATPLTQDRGQTKIEDVVISKIAGMAAAEVSGVYDLGAGGPRVVGALRDSIPGARTASQQGVAVTVHDSSATVDLALVAEYGVAIHQLADVVRQNVISAIEKMTGLPVSDVNISILDVHLSSDDAVDSPK